eukprot:gene4899-9766_t
MKLKLVLLFVCQLFNIMICKGSIFKSNALCWNSNDKNKERKLLPKLLPHNDPCYLIAVGADNNDNCEQMEPVLQRLEEDLDTKVRRISLSRRREFLTALEIMGHDECGGLPFYYNRRTGQAVCGATTYVNLKKLGTGDLNHLFNDAPENIQAMESEGYGKKNIGAKGYLIDKVNKLEKKGKAKAEEQTKKLGSKEESKRKSAAAERTEARRIARELRKQKST